MQKLKDAFIPMIFYSNLIVFILVILYRYFLQNKRQKIRDKKSLMFKSPHILCISLYLGFLAFSMNQLSQHDLQYYKVLNITRDYTLKNVAKANRKILRDLHPDLKTGDQMKFMIHSETVQAFQTMPVALRKIYNMFHEDIFILHSQKSIDSYEIYHSKLENISIMFYGFALLLTLFVFKFVHLRSQKVKTSVLVVFGLCYLIECIFFDYHKSFGDLQLIVLNWIDSQAFLNQCTYYEVFIYIKLSLFFMQQLGVIIYLPMIVEKPMVILSQIDVLEEHSTKSEIWRKQNLNKAEGNFYKKSNQIIRSLSVND